jgi:hypothetical protein
MTSPKNRYLMTDEYKFGWSAKELAGIEEYGARPFPALEQYC